MVADKAVLSVRGVGKRYGEREALRPLDFDVSPGELIAVVGPNGAGKTTLLSILAGVQPPTAGSVSAPADGLTVGWAPQQPALYSKLSVAENLRLFARLERVADPEEAVERMLEQTGLRTRAHERVERLSGGNRQRVSVAVGLIADPPVLALDEPSSALDPAQRERLWRFVDALASQGTAVLFSTHHLSEVRRHATRVLVLADGELLLDGTPAELAAASGGGEDDFERTFVAFLAERGH
ncbi:MAG TPA: ABC transporter ATP-binding protein [Solirubrobacteraceae bacterium]|jgi:ABC-2 type transport system ATP-binding protein